MELRGMVSTNYLNPSIFPFRVIKWAMHWFEIVKLSINVHTLGKCCKTIMLKALPHLLINFIQIFPGFPTELIEKRKGQVQIKRNWGYNYYNGQ